jgi:hypothetical protein
MDFGPLIETVQSRVGEVLPNLVGALALLVAGWIVAVALRAGVRKLLGMFNVNERLTSTDGSGMDVEAGVSTGVYYLVLLLVLVAFFDALHLELVSGPLGSLVDQFFGYLPNLIAGGALLFIAVMLATVIRGVVRRGLGATSLDERLAEQAGMAPVSQTLGTVLYWLILLLFLPGILGAFEVRGLLEPVEAMVNKSLAMVPNILAAGVIGFVGWLVARIVRDLVANLLAAAGVDRLGTSAGLRGTMTLSRLIGLVVFVLILIPALTAALNALQIDAITAPATTMLAAVMNAIPNVFAAAVILGIAYFVSRFVAGLISELLGGAGFDHLPERIGLGQAFSGEVTPSKLVGTLIIFFVMLFAAVEAAGQMGFGQVSDLVATLIEFAGQVLLGTVIIAVGFWLSNLALDAVRRVYGDSSTAVANIVRFAILGLVLAMGLRAMGLADDIVNLAFGLTLGAVAVAVALAFGLGGREAAGRQMEHWLGQLRSPSRSPARGRKRAGRR